MDDYLNKSSLVHIVIFVALIGLSVLLFEVLDRAEGATDAPDETPEEAQ